MVERLHSRALPAATAASEMTVHACCDLLNCGRLLCRAILRPAFLCRAQLLSQGSPRRDRCSPFTARRILCL